MKILKLIIASLAFASLSAFAGDFVTYNNGINKINLNQVAYVAKADNQDAATFYLTNGTVIPNVAGSFMAVRNNPNFLNDGSYYASATVNAKLVNTKLITSAVRSQGTGAGLSKVTYTMVGGYVVAFDLGSEAFLGSYWNNLN